MSLLSPAAHPGPEFFSLREQAPREKPTLAEVPWRWPLSQLTGAADAGHGRAVVHRPRAPAAAAKPGPARPPQRQEPIRSLRPAAATALSGDPELGNVHELRSQPATCPGRLELRQPGAAAHAGAGLRAGAVVQPGRAGHFSGLHRAAGDLLKAGEARGHADASCGFDHPPSHVRAAGRARAGLGWIDLQAQCTAPGDALLPAAVTGAGWMDRLTVHATGLDGARGEISVALNLSAALRAGANGSAAARLMLGLWVDGVAVPLLPAPCWGGRPRLGEPGLDEALGSLVVARLPVVFGRPFELAVFALARAGCEPALPPPPVLPSPAIAPASVAAGLRWAGLRSVHAASRSKALMHFKQYRLASASGHDWRPAQHGAKP